eukprot:5347227-Prymnesium_polylepis.1
MAPELPDAYPSRVLDNRKLEQLGEQLDGIIEMNGVNTERVDIPHSKITVNVTVDVTGVCSP